MEKVIITECNVIFRGKAHGCTFADGRQAIAWNDKVDAGVLMQAFSSGEEIEVELKPYNSKGRQGLHIVEVKSGTTAMTSEAPSLQEVHNAKQGNAHTNGQYQASRYTPESVSDKSKSIVAQCLTKCVASRLPEASSDIQGLRDVVFETYNFFLENL